jgi:sugar lactone lactonase YvrE
MVSLVGCSAGGGPVQPPLDANSKAVIPAAHAKGAGVHTTYRTSATLVFVGDTSSEVQIYPAKKLKKNPAPMATITDAIGCPYGLAMDKRGTLYVANECAPNSKYSVTEYSKGETTHSVTITDGINYPAGLAVDKARTLYVSNSAYNDASIAEYAAGATSPSKVITGSGLVAPWGLTLDAKQNLYVADYVAVQVYEIPKGTSKLEPLNLQGLSKPVGVAFDSSGNLWVADLAGFVNVYPPGGTSPSETLSYGYTTPFAISEDAHGTIVVANWQSPDVVYEYAPGQYSAEAALTKDIKTSTGVLIRKP